jgi:hypothetical protein
MFEAMDSAGVGMQPKLGSNKILSLYFFIFTLVFKLFLIRIFASIMVKNYMNFRNERMGYNTLT